MRSRELFYFFFFNEKRYSMLLDDAKVPGEMEKLEAKEGL